MIFFAVIGRETATPIADFMPSAHAQIYRTTGYLTSATDFGNESLT